MDTKVDFSNEVRAIFERIRLARRRTPLDWRDEAFAREKAHVAALHALLAYAAVPALELRQSHRVKIVPCDLHARALAAGRPVDLRVLLRELGYEEFNVFVVSNRRAVVVGLRSPEAIFVAIRGTASLWDALIDLRAWQLRPYLDTPLRFHRGFYVSIASLRWQIVRELQRWGLDRPLVITGHSLGGAMAAILNALNEFRGYWMGEAPGHASSCYTLGMPRYGNAAALLTQPYPFHVYDLLDVVPRVPPALFGYARPYSAEYCVQNGLAPEPRVAAPSLLLSRLRHHKMENYLAGLNAITRLES